MMRLSYASLIACLLSSSIQFVVSVDETVFQCVTGYKNGKATMEVIPPEWKNDGYCDCPFDGSDEPDTGACSGSTAWPGIIQTTTEEEIETTKFACPQQPDLKLPHSRLNDGICDCCEGADEAEGICEDQCEEILREAREARQRLEEAFKKGSIKRKHELYAFKKFREEKLEEVQDMEARKKDLNPDSIIASMEQLKQDYFNERVKVVQNIVSTAAEALLGGLSLDEIQSLLIHSCQLAGEMDAYSDDDDACVPLRLAGLDLGLSWPVDDYNNASSMTTVSSDDILIQIADVLFTNAADEKRSYALSVGSTSGRRRLDETWDDDEHYDDDEFDRRYGDDDYTGDYGDYEDDDRYASRASRHSSANTSMKKELTGAAKDHFDRVIALPFSATRRLFLDRSKEVVDAISKALDAKPKESEEETAEGEDAESDESKSAFDPAAYTMMKSNLARKQSSIEKGIRWASSAKLFVDANQSLGKEKFEHLSLLTIYHGKLSSLQIWQILQASVDEFIVPPTTFESETCASPWAGACPPKIIERQAVSIPAAGILAAAETFCAGQTAFTETVCGAKAQETGPIPTSIPDGYFGYVVPIPRDDQDEIASLFARLSSLPADKSAMEALEEEKETLVREKKELEKEITKLWKDIGGKKGDKMGPNGELFALADKCFDVEAGKYVYEVCVFGQAKQKEGSNKGGTALGTFKRMDYDPETGKRTMFWENGAKCWNGPHRSAEVEITCGADNRVLSADEPDTCRYVLQMESHIACDDQYRQKIGL